MADNRINIFDTTLRDGEQAPGCSMTLREKLRVAKALTDLRVDVIEAGFPAASPGDFDSVRAIADENRGPTICGLARCNPEDIEKVHAAVKGADKHRIHVFVATSEIHREHKLKMAKEEILNSAASAVSLARELCDDVEFSPEDASRTELAFLAEVNHSDRIQSSQIARRVDLQRCRFNQLAQCLHVIRSLSGAASPRPIRIP